MANKYSSALEKAQKMVEEQSRKVQQNTSNLTNSNYASAFQKVGILQEPQTISPGFMFPDQAPAVSSLIPQPTLNDTLNSFLISEQNRKQREQQEAEEAARQQRQQAISNAMNSEFLSKVKGNQPTTAPEIPSAPAVSDPLQKILDLVSGNATSAGTRNPALPEVTVNNGVAADDWRRGIRQYTDENGNIIRDEDGNAYAVDKLRQDSNTARKNVSQTGIGWLDNILDTLNYSAQKAGAGLENEIDNLFASLDAGAAGAGRLVNPNRRVQWQSYNPTQIEEPIKPLSGKAFRQAENAIASSLDQSGADGLYNNKVGALNEKYGKVAENPFVQGVAGLDEAIARQLPYIAAGQIASSAALGGALSQGFANGLTGAEAMREAIASARAVGNTASAVSRALSSYSRAFKEGRADGADSIQALQYANQEAINQGIGEFLLGGIGGMGEGMLGKVAANTKVGRSLAKAIGTHITSPLLKTAIRYAGTLGGEGIEEMIQDVVTVANKRATYKPDAKISGKELVYSGVLGAAMAGVFNAPGLPATYQAYKADYDTINNLSKAAASASSFEDVQAVRRMCDLIIDECETSLGEKNISSFGTTAAKNETDLDLRMRYEYLRYGAQQIRDILGTDSTAIIEGNTKFDEDVSFATDAPVDNIVEETANIVVDVADTLEPGADVIRGTIDRVNEEIQDITQTEEDIRQMSEEEFAEWFYNSRFKNIFPGIAEAVHGSAERLLAAPRTYENDTSVVTDNETAENIVRQDIAAQMRTMLDELKTRKEVLNQINATLRNNKEDVKEGVTDILTSSGDGDTIETTNPDIQADGKSLMPETTDKPVPSSGDTRFDVLRSPYEHTQTHKQFDLLQTPKGLSSEDRDAFKKAVKDNGGYWSGFAKGWLVPEGKWDGVQKALEDLNIGIRTEGTESPSAQTETPQNTTPAEGERTPEFVVGGPSESAGAETITAERPDIPEFEVAGNTDMVPQSGTTEVQNGSETAVNEAGTRSDTGRGTNETADNGTVSTATAPEVDGLNVPETTTGKTNVNAEGNKEQEESEKAQAKWTPDSKEKLTDENFPYKVGDTFKRPNSGAECKIEKFGDGMITLDFGNYIPLTMEYSSFAAQLRNGQLIESKVSREAEQQTETDKKSSDDIYEQVSNKLLNGNDNVKVGNYAFGMRRQPGTFGENAKYQGVAYEEDKNPNLPQHEVGKNLKETFSTGWNKSKESAVQKLMGAAKQRGLLDGVNQITDREPVAPTPKATDTQTETEYDVLSDRLMVAGTVKMHGLIFSINGKNGDYSGTIKRQPESYGPYPIENARDTIYNKYYPNTTREKVVEDFVGVAENNKLFEYADRNAKAEETVDNSSEQGYTETGAEAETTTEPESTSEKKPEKVPEDSAAPTEDTKPYTKIADWVADRLNRDLSIDKKDLQVVANDAYGGTQAQGAYDVKDLTDALELGVNKHIIKDVSENLDEYVGSARTAVGALSDIEEFILGKIPTQTNRTEEQIALQQFSTPPNIAYVANWVANIDKNDTMLEPSAGIGGLASFAKGMGAKTIVNELSERRLSLLKTLPFDGFYHENAEQIDNILPDSVKPTVVVMNPPFSANGRTKNKTANAIPHIEQALERLEPGGRLVAILGGGRDEGGGMSDSAPSFKAWWNKLRDDYSIRANIGIDGSNYKKYGTSFNVRLVVIDKTGPQEEPTLTGEYKDLAEAIKDLEEIRNDRTRTERSAKGKADSGTKQNGTVQNGGGASENGKPSGTGTRTDSGKRPTDSSSVHNSDTASGSVRGAHGAGTSGNVGTAPEGEVQNSDNERESGRGREPVDDAKSDSNGERGESGSGRVGAGESGAGTSGESEILVQSESGIPGASGTLISDDRKTSKLKKTTKKAAENDDGVYAEYKPAELTVSGARKHPAKLVESSAMSAVQSPPLTYKPKLSQKLIDAGAWSDAQLENICYAGQAHQDILPNGERKGYFVGDGTGVGKGRQIAGIIMDNFNQGRKKAVWVSEKFGLMEDAKRDWRDVGGDENQVFSYTDAAKKKTGLPSEGIMFITYDTLRSQSTKTGKTTLSVLEDWFGNKYDGVIIFDEAHNMGNAKPQKSGFGVAKASKKALSGVQLQKDLPNARIAYFSATGATKIENLAYASRLGLWGEGTAFKDSTDFITKIGNAGISAMELVARDMKAEGVYLARSISYDDVTYDNLHHTLSSAQRSMYDRMSDAWQVVLQNFDKAIDLTNSSNSMEVKRKRSQAYSNMQMFYNQILTSMSMPSVITDIEKELAKDHSCVIQLVNTNEAAQTREVQRIKEDENASLDDIDITPRQLLVGYVEKCFPIYQYEEYLDDEGNLQTRVVEDSEGNPVINKRALAMRDSLIADLNEIAIPEGPLDMLLNHFGVDQVAEITGRSQRVVNKMDESGNLRKTLERRDSKKANIAETKAFQDGDKRILVFSGAGSTGRSFHADKRAKNQQQRIHYVLQPGWKAETAVQGFGRTHRSNQVVAPVFRLVSTDVKGHKRFVTSIAKRLEQLGALTKGQRETGSGVFGEKDNLESPLSVNALKSFYKKLGQGNYVTVGDNGDIEGLDAETILKDMGLYDKFYDEYGNFNADTPVASEITTFLNRILALRVETQNEVFDAFETERDRMYQEAIDNGTLDRGLENVKADKIEIADEQVVYTDPKTGAETKYVRAKLFVKPKVVTTVAEAKTAHDGFVGIYRMEDGSVRAAYRRKDGTDSRTGEVYKQYYLIGPNQGKVSNYRESTLMATCQKVEKEDWQKAWDEELKDVPEYNEGETHMITGALLPVWDKLPQTGNIKARRITASDGTQFLGRIIDPSMIESTLRQLGANITKIQRSGAELRALIMGQGKQVTFNGSYGGVYTVSRKRVSGENRMEISGGNMWNIKQDFPNLIQETIQYSRRYFIPDSRAGEEILQKLSDKYGVRSIGDSENSGNMYSAGLSSGKWGKGKHDKNAEVMSINDLVDEAERIFGIPINTGRISGKRKGVQGVFKEFPETIRVKQYGDLPTIAHEIGHFLDKKYLLHESPYIKAVVSEFEDELLGAGYNKAAIPGESVAEYFREYMEDREATEKKFKQFTNWMYDTINATDQKRLIHYSSMTNAYYASDLERRADAQVHYRTDEDTILGNAQVVAEYLKEDPHGYLGGKGRDFMRAWFDDIHDLRGMARAYDFAFLAKRANGIAAARLKYHMTNLNGDIVGPSLATILSDAQITSKAKRKAFDTYLIARRALDHFEANKRGENLPTLVYADEELNNADSLVERIQKMEDAFPSFHEASERLYALQNQMLDLAIEAGIMPTRGDITMEDMKQRLNELYPHYVPLYRKMDDPQAKAVAGSKYGSNNSPIAHFKGSGRDIYSPIENIMINMAKYTSLSLVAQVKRNIYDFVTQNEGMGMIAEEVPASKILDRISTDEIKKKLDALGKDVEALSYLSEDAKKDVLDTITEVIGDTTGQWKIKTKQGTNIMPVMVDGKVHYLEIHDEGLMKTLENLEPKQFNLLTQFMGKFTRFKKLFATGINAKFAATNVARDLNTGFVSSSTTNNPFEYGTDFIKEFVSSLLADYNGPGSTIPWVQSMRERYEYFQLQGGGYMGAYTHDYDLLRKLDKEIMDDGPNIKKVFRAIGGIMMKLIESGENASRQAEFYRAIDKGFDNLDAFRMSQEVTVNFDRGGSYVKGINQYVPYRQAAFNATYHMADLFASGGRGGRGGNGGGNNTNDSVSRNRRNAITKWIMLGVASALLAALLSYLIGNKLKGESKEKILEEREKLSKYRKMNYWNIYIGDGKFFELRKETMLNAPLNTIERLVDYYVLEQGDALDGLAEDLVDAILPVDVLHPVNDIVGGTSGLGTIYNLARNKDFKDTPIEPEWMERQNIPYRDRYSDTTSEVWKKLGEILNQSPIKMQYAIEDNFAFWGQTFDRATSKSGDVWAGFNNSFIADNVYSTDIINTFYNQKEKYDSPKKGEDELETDYGSWKYQQIAGMYSDLNRFYKNESDSDYARMMRSTTNDLILQVNRAGMTDLDRAVIETIRGNTTEIKNVCPYITPPDHYTENKVQFDMGYEDKVTYYLQEQEMFKEGYAQILQSGYDNDTTSAMLVAYHKEVKKQLDAYWKQLLIDRANNGQ